MGRKKAATIDDGLHSSDSEGLHGFDETGLQVTKRKRRLRDNEDADVDEELAAEAQAKGRQYRNGGYNTLSYLNGQAFVPASDRQNDCHDEPEDGSDNEDDDDDNNNSNSNKNKNNSNDNKKKRKSSPTLQRDQDKPQEDLERPSFAGIGNRHAKTCKEAFHSPSFVSSRGDRNLNATTPPRSAVQPLNNEKTMPSSSRLPAVTPAEMENSGMPSTFGAEFPTIAASDAFRKKSTDAKPKRSLFSGGGEGMTPHTNIKFGGGLGGGFNPAAYLASMGWEGGGLGERGQGIDKPIEVQLRPERAGIAFGGRRERTKQERQEAKKRGEIIDDSDEDDGKKGHKGRAQKADTTAPSKSAERPWTKKSKPRKPAVQYQTYDQIFEAAGGAATTNAGVGPIIDARGRESREIADIASALASHPVPTSDSTRLPELRHNLRLIAEESKRTLHYFAKKGASIVQRRTWLKREREESIRWRTKEEASIQTLRAVLALVTELELLGKQTLTDSSTTLSNFSPLVERIERELSEADVEMFKLDEALVGAIVPLFKRTMLSWTPLEDAEASSSASLFQHWRKTLRIPEEDARSLVDLSGIAQPARPKTAHVGEMSPFASLLWHLWMPKIRSAINNDWKPHHPRAALAVLSAWKPLLPRYIWDNAIDQVLLPKLLRTIQHWELRTAKASLHHILFPWLPLLENRLDECMSEARRRLRSSLNTWRMRDLSDHDPASASAIADEERNLRRDVEHWREMFPSRHDFDSMMLVCVVPKLSSHLQRRFTVNPSKQDMAPLQRVLVWRELLQTSMLCRILETEFLPKWLTTLHSWLIQPGADLGQVAQWYSFWKSWFKGKGGLDVDGPDMGAGKKLHGVKRGFDKAIDLISQAIELGEDDEGRREKLAKPDLTPVSRSATAAVAAADGKGRRPEISQKLATSGTLPDDVDVDGRISFRVIVEERLLADDILVVPLHRAHEATGKRLLRATSAAAAASAISSSARSGEGVTFYLDDDVIWAQKKVASSASPSGSGEFVPISLDDLIKRSHSRVE